MSSKKTVVLGASPNPQRYSYLAVNKLSAHQHEVIPIGKSVGIINKLEVITDTPDMNDVDTVTLYLNPANQQSYYDYIVKIHPKRIIFNPGSENPELAKLAEENGIQTINACTLVLLSTNQY